MYLYPKDLGDLRSLVTSRGRDTHVHFCVDAQTDLKPPRPSSANIGTATTVSHRVEEHRIFESFITKILLTVTSHFEDDVAINIHACNLFGKHEPQQIDYILSINNSLRSRTFDSSATKSDHWGLITAIKSKT